MWCDPPCFFLRHSTSFLSTKYILLFLVDTNFCSTKFFSKIFFCFCWGGIMDVDLGTKLKL